MYFAMDMGTSNTRLWLCDGDEVIYEKKSPFGAKISLGEGRVKLFELLKGAILEALAASDKNESDIECLLSSGMSTSELGLLELEHIKTPCGFSKLKENVKSVSIPEIASFPFVFVPGVKSTLGDGITDVMRGEETELLGILKSGKVKLPATVVLPGTHNKIIRVSAEGEIADFSSTLSGETIDILIKNSILSSISSHSFDLSESDALRGMIYSKKRGLSAALYQVRVMQKNGEDSDACSSFLYGAVLGEDAALIEKISEGGEVYVGGNSKLAEVLCLLLVGERVHKLDGELCKTATRVGIQSIYEALAAEERSKKIKAAVEKEKIVAIVRNPDPVSLISAISALYEGGIRMVELTFDRSGKVTPEQTAKLISTLSREFCGRMYIGAGTVTCPEQVRLATGAGAAFIISPNCDPEIIRLTKELGAVSMPAAYTPTEIAEALKCGADFIKLFPADDVSQEYVKAVRAPLSDAKLLAVGGVSAENVGEFINMGFVGVGVGSNLYDKKLIEKGDFASLRALAKKYVDAVKK